MLNEKVLYILERNRGRIVTGGDLAKQLGVSRTAIWKTIASLRNEGNEIESVPNSGYRLDKSSDGLCAQTIGDYLTTKLLGRSLELLKTVDSTNNYIKSRDTALMPEGHTVISDEQTYGRGRLGRTFYSPAHSGVYMSCLLTPPVPLAETPFLTICAAVAVCRALEDVCGMKVGVKWVNDIFYEGKKLCGILTEASITAEMRHVDSAVVGIGVNTGDIAPQVAELATSVYRATGMRGVRNRLAAEILNQLETVYFDYSLHGKKREILSAYEQRLFILGKRVEVVESGGCFVAEVEGIDDSGALVVRDESNGPRRIISGEIRINQMNR